MSRWSQRAARLNVGLCVTLFVLALHAEEVGGTTRAREEFLRGAAFVRDAQWSEALIAFQRSSELVSHHTTTFNIAVCERALGRYVRARRTLARAREQSLDAAEVDTAFLESVQHYSEEIERLLAHVEVRIEPADAAIAVDGSPLVAASEEHGVVFVAGLAGPGKGRVVSRSAFELLVDPGAHVVTVTRSGFGDVVLSHTFKPGDNPALVLSLSRLPARLLIDANRPGAVVRVNGVDVGVAPVEVSRPAGSYDISVQRHGFITYRSHVAVRAGEELTLSARLQNETPALTSRWWFWTAVGGAVVATAATTYFATRPEPERPPVDGGGLGWALEVP